MKADCILELIDGQQQFLGQVRMEGEEAGLVLGEFTPAPAFAAVAALFREFEAAADRQALHRVEELDASIAALGLRLRSDGSGQRGSRRANLERRGLQLADHDLRSESIFAGR